MMDIVDKRVSLSHQAANLETGQSLMDPELVSGLGKSSTWAKSRINSW